MAIHHAGVGELIDLAEWPHDVEPGKSHTLIVADGLTVARLFLHKDQAIPECELPAAITIQCLSGKFELITSRSNQMLIPGQLVYLPAGDRHELLALEEDTVVLLTIAN